MRLVVAIAAGGYSEEEEISLQSAQTVYDNLDKNLYEGIIVLISKEGWQAKLGDEYFPINREDFSIEFEERRIKFDFVFIAIHGTPGEDGRLQAYFDLLNLPYSSSNHVGATLTFNKWYCSTLLKQLDYSVAKSQYLRKGDAINKNQIIDKIGIPCFVKPCSCGSSYGITKVKTDEQLEWAIEKAFEFDHEIMIEEYLDGIELTCGVYQKEGKVIALPITQIIPKGEFFDYEAKYEGNSYEITPARIPEDTYSSIQIVSSEIYEKLELKGVARIDYMLVNNVPYIIEVNAVPGLSSSSLIPQQVDAANLSLRSFFSTIIEETYKKTQVANTNS